MQMQRTRDTHPEMAVRRQVHALGLRYRVDAAVLPGLRRRADLAFPKQRVAVFVDGCFWHGCSQHSTQPKSNVSFWTDKLAHNQQRDRDTDQRLAAAGWTVVRVWEHEAPEEAAQHIETLIRGSQSG
jgi:DNA mismatch endonuclease (patch repair protein)